ncbi:MAG: DUF1343 domain-containing protein [Hyphomicrobiaceae bacterium]
MGLFEATAASEGRGTNAPFLQIGHPAIDGADMAERLTSARLPGVAFAPIAFTPRAIPGMASAPRFKNRTIEGIALTLTDPAAFRPVETGVQCLAAFTDRLHSQGENLIADPVAFDRLAGSNALREALRRKIPGADIPGMWEEDIKRFRQNRRKYLIYD